MAGNRVYYTSRFQLRYHCFLSAPGLVCAAGAEKETFFRAVMDGSLSGIKPGRALNGKNFLRGQTPDDFIIINEGNRFQRLALSALARLEREIDAVKKRFSPERIGFCLGSCDNGSEVSFLAHKEYFEKGRFPADYRLDRQTAAWPASFLAARLGLGGPALTVSTACASSGGAIIKAAEFIQAGICDAVIAGGADIASDTVLLGFDALSAVSQKLCNPFSRNRDGITLGEGAAFFVLCREAELFDGPAVELLGWGESADASHITAPRSDGSGAAAAMRKALRAAGLSGGDIAYVNLHGTGTELNDAMEARAMNAVFSAGEMPFASSTKPITGHTLGAASALELAVCWMTLGAETEGRLPPHRWDGEADENIPSLRLAGPDSRAKNIRYCMNNSFAFGGCDTSLVIGKI